jgi:hypothetical protein
MSTSWHRSDTFPQLQRKGILEETLPAKKIKSYLWNQRLISRFNDDGKKSKSKGNHIWNVDAKRLPDGQWIFRPFQRKIHLPEPLHAWYGSKFAWQPKVWDPQASTSNLKVDWRFEGLPPWLESKSFCYCHICLTGSAISVPRFKRKGALSIHSIFPSCGTLRVKVSSHLLRWRITIPG